MVPTISSTHRLLNARMEKFMYGVALQKVFFIPINSNVFVLLPSFAVLSADTYFFHISIYKMCSIEPLALLFAFFTSTPNLSASCQLTKHGDRKSYTSAFSRITFGLRIYDCTLFQSTLYLCFLYFYFLNSLQYIL